MRRANDVIMRMTSYDNSWLMEIWRLATCGHGLQRSSNELIMGRIGVEVAEFVEKMDSLMTTENSHASASAEPVTSSAAVNDDDDDKNDVDVTSPADDDTTKKKTRKKRKSSRKSEEIIEEAAKEQDYKGF